MSLARSQGQDAAGGEAPELVRVGDKVDRADATADDDGRRRGDRLPARRVDALVEAGDGIHFDANKGTPMREWLSLDPGSGQDWLALACEALDFARSR